MVIERCLFCKRVLADGMGIRCGAGFICPKRDWEACSERSVRA